MKKWMILTVFQWTFTLN